MRDRQGEAWVYIYRPDGGMKCRLGCGRLGRGGRSEPKT